jgi:hypothetical protein
VQAYLLFYVLTPPQNRPNLGSTKRTTEQNEMSRQEFASAMVKKARSVNWLCIWPRASHPISRASARANRDRYIQLARKALQD